MNRFFFLLTLLCTIHCRSVAQNLVMNNSFEQYLPDSINNGYGNGCVCKAEHWLNAGPWSTDWFHSDYNTVSPRVPDNENGTQVPHTGDAYAGIYTFAIANAQVNIRGYIRTQLVSPLVAGEVYTISFYASLSDHSMYATGFGFNISPVQENTFDGNLLLAPEHGHTPGTITDKQNWTLVSANYQASGGEQYLTIGGLQDDQNCDTMMVSGMYYSAYYYIDDVSVTSIKSEGVHDPNSSATIIYPNPSTSTLYLKANQDISGYDITVTDILGRHINCNWQPAGSSLLQSDISGWPSGVYYINISMASGRERIIKL